MKSQVEGQRRNKLLAATAEYDIDFVSYLYTLLAEIEENPKLEVRPETKVATQDADIHNQRQKQPISVLLDVDGLLGMIQAA